jgi:hypothetical protein
MTKFTDAEYSMIIAGLKNMARRQENATKAVRADDVEATRSALTKIQAMRKASK